MALEDLLGQYENDNRILSLIREVEGNPSSRIHYKGMRGSQSAVVAAAVYRKASLNHLFILEDKEEAAFFMNDLQNLLDKKDILFVPDSFKKPGFFDEVNSNNVLLRTEAVNKLSNSGTKGEILVSYPEAIFEKIVSPQLLKGQTLYIAKGEKLDILFIADLLTEYGFERVDFVFEPGQFSVRGDIVDIYSFGNDYPYRVEVFGDEVESIRIFDPITQLSNKMVLKVTIIPNINTQFGTEQKLSLPECLPDNTLIWISDTKLVLDKIEFNFDKVLKASKEGARDQNFNESHPFSKYPIPELFAAPTDLIVQLGAFSIVEIGTDCHFETAKAYQFKAEQQPPFNKNFKMLIENLNENTASGKTNFLFAGNSRQIERFYQIFHDLRGEEAPEIQFQPIAKVLSRGYIDHDLKIACYTDHQIFERYNKYVIRKGFSRSESLNLKQIRDLQPGDFVTHIDHGIGVYSGLEKIEINGHVQETVRLIYRDNDLLYVNINSLHKIAKYSSKDGKQPNVNKLGSDAWENLKRKTKKKVKDIAKDLIQLYAKRRAAKGFAFSPDTYLQTELEASFIYEDTPDQLKATIDVKKDMESAHPMDRLVCGDVGFGKTEVALRAAFKAVADSKQVAVLVPTTILAFQHFKTFSERLGEFPCTIDYLNRFRSSKEKKEVLNNLKEGKIDILIGTHGILGKTVEYQRLGLIIIDEEQKFGVAAKEKLKQLKTSVDTLTLTATPIPRTLKFSLLGARDLSIINTAPPNRQPITTELKTFDPEFIREAIYYEIYRGGQIFFIHNRVKDIAAIHEMIMKLCPDIDVGVAHGQMEGHLLEEHMLRFVNRQYDVLVCTNIVESGLDIPNANTIIINNAHWFGLSDLHQLRGRVGRSNKKAFCYLMSPPLHVLNDDARKRLKTIEEFSELGSGFKVSMRDLDIRGAGNLLGGEQSGFITDIGFDTYHKILDEAIQELKSTEFKEIFAEEMERKREFVRDCQIDTDLEMLIPGEYVSSSVERMSLYTRIDNIENENDLEKFRIDLKDRFGPIPRQVDELFNAVRLRWLAKDLGFERIVFKNNKLRCYFIQNNQSAYYQSEIFGSMMQYLQQSPGKFRLKQARDYLILVHEGLHKMSQAREKLLMIHSQVCKMPAESSPKKG